MGLLICVGVFVLPGVIFAQGKTIPRFSARFSDGSRAEGNALVEWHVPQAAPKLDGRPLLDPNNPILWLRDRSLTPGALPKACVELVGGDCLPGIVTGYYAGTETSFDPLPAHFIVRPETVLRPPQPAEQPTIRVLSRFVRRIVWQRLGRDDFRPSTVFYRDGRSAEYRAARFGDGSVSLLLADGPRKVPYGEIAEIHFPTADPWEAYFDELVMLAANPKTRLLQLEATDGLAITSSLLDRMNVHVVGNPIDPSRWVHGLQPAWSLDMIWVPCNTVWMRRLFSVHEPLLCRVTPLAAKQSSSSIVAAGNMRINRNELGGPLRSGQLDFGSGFGVHSPSELSFPLPACVQGLRTFVGLDRAAGKGGCIGARVFANATTSPPIFENRFLVGSDQVADTGVIPLTGPDEGQKSIVLQIDAAHAGRPEGADPLDIRDVADWFDPVLLLDLPKLMHELERRRSHIAPAWHDWTLRVNTEGPPEQAGVLELANYWDDLAPSPGAYRSGVYARLQPFSLSREIDVGPQDNWLIIGAHQQVNPAQPTRLEVRINGEPVAEFTVPPRSRDQRHPAPLALPLVNFKGHKVHVEIRQYPATAPAPVVWQSLQVVDQLPTLHAIFSDEGTFSPIEAFEGGEAALIDDDKHSGARSLKLTPSKRFQLKLPHSVAIRERPEWGEYRYLRFAFRKFGKGRISLELDQLAADAKPARYDAGNGSPAFGAAKRVWTLDLPSEWIVMTRDLFADFGKLDVTGLTLSAVDGQYALFDHVYVARSEKDFESIGATTSAEATNQKARRELAKDTLFKIMPASVAIDLGDGRFGTGTLFTPDGWVFTAGHLAIGPNRPVTVYLADGRSPKGKTRGVHRDLDLGLIKLDEPGPWPYVELNTVRDIPLEQLFIGVSHKAVFAPKAVPAAHVVGIRRVFRGMIWTDFDLDDFSAGGPLVDKDGRLVGVHNRRSPFGGFMFSRLDEVPPVLERLKNGELIGTWHPGTGPTFGATVAVSRDGAKISAVQDGGPAAKAGLLVGDILKRVKGKSVVSLEDIQAATADNDPGQEVVFEYLRNTATAEARVILAPRTP